MQGDIEVSCGGLAEAFHVAIFERLYKFVEKAECFFTSAPFFTGAEEIFFANHFKNGADILRHPPMDDHEGVL